MIPIQLETPKPHEEYNFVKQYPWWAWMILALSILGIVGVIVGMIVTEVMRHG